MKKIAIGLCLMFAILITVAEGCKTRQKTTVAKSNPVPANTANADSSGTSPSPKLTPTPVPNVRPNPIPNPQPPNPPL